MICPETVILWEQTTIKSSSVTEKYIKWLSENEV